MPLFSLVSQKKLSVPLLTLNIVYFIVLQHCSYSIVYSLSLQQTICFQKARIIFLSPLYVPQCPVEYVVHRHYIHIVQVTYTSFLSPKSPLQQWIAHSLEPDFPLPEFCLCSDSATCGLSLSQTCIQAESFPKTSAKS